MDDNVFDDVDAILDEEIGSDEDKNFNESELQDIMSEIENLEKEFVTEETPSMSLQDEIEAELERELGAEMNEAVAPEPQVLAFEKPAPVIVDAPIVAKAPVIVPIQTTTNSSEVSFAAHGQMSFNLDFKVGNDVAKLTVDPVKGLLVTVSGVEVSINEDSGCTVLLENGMTFTIPLSSQDKSLKKKAG